MLKMDLSLLLPARCPSSRTLSLLAGAVLCTSLLAGAVVVPLSSSSPQELVGLWLFFFVQHPYASTGDYGRMPFQKTRRNAGRVCFYSLQKLFTSQSSLISFSISSGRSCTRNISAEPALTNKSEKQVSSFSAIALLSEPAAAAEDDSEEESVLQVQNLKTAKHPDIAQNARVQVGEGDAPSKVRYSLRHW